MFFFAKTKPTWVVRPCLSGEFRSFLEGEPTKHTKTGDRSHQTLFAAPLTRGGRRLVHFFIYIFLIRQKEKKIKKPKTQITDNHALRNPKHMG